MKGSCTSRLNLLLYSCSGAASSSLWCADVFFHADRGARRAGIDGRWHGSGTSPRFASGRSQPFTAVHPGHCRRTWLEEGVDYVGLVAVFSTVAGMLFGALP